MKHFIVATVLCFPAAAHADLADSIGKLKSKLKAVSFRSPFESFQAAKPTVTPPASVLGDVTWAITMKDETEKYFMKGCGVMGKGIQCGNIFLAFKDVKSWEWLDDFGDSITK